MSLKSGKHEFGDYEGRTVTYVEQKVDAARARFLKDLLEANRIPVILIEIPPADPEGMPLYTVATPDLVFNPVIAVYQRRLRTRDGRRVTPAYYNQESEDCDPGYFY